MTRRLLKRWMLGLGLVVLLALGGWGLWTVTLPEAVADSDDGRGPVPVEVARVRSGPIALRRQFSGSLESPELFTVAPKVGGQIVELPFRLGDTVRRGDVIARLDAAEYAMSLAQAEAELAVARANVAQARSNAEIAERAWQRTTTLAERGVASEQVLDTATAERLASSSAVKVAEAQVLQAEAEVGIARVRLEYATLTANWSEGGSDRVVGEVMVELGDTVAANTPMLTLVSLDPIRAVVYVTEADYAQLTPGKPVAVTTDAYPGETFHGEVARVAPVFSAASRQARVEVRVENPDMRLKPGMFVRVDTTLRSIDQALSIPEVALTQRDNRIVVFVVGKDGRRVAQQAVEVGIRDAGWVQIVSPALSGRVVTLGQQLLAEGSEVNIVNAGVAEPAASVASGDDKAAASGDPSSEVGR